MWFESLLFDLAFGLVAVKSFHWQSMSSFMKCLLSTLLDQLAAQSQWMDFQLNWMEIDEQNSKSWPFKSVIHSVIHSLSLSSRNKCQADEQNNEENFELETRQLNSSSQLTVQLASFAFFSLLSWQDKKDRKHFASENQIFTLNFQVKLNILVGKSNHFAEGAKSAN